MTDDIQARVEVAAPPARVYRALTDARELAAWFAEHADVSLPDGRYEFWGRYAPEGQRGRQRLLAAEPDRLLRFAWRLDDTESTVEITLAGTDSGTVVTVRQETDGPDTHIDFWLVSMANLASHVEGRSLGVRFDFTDRATTEARDETTIDAPPDRVFAALTEPEQLTRWMMATDPVVEPQVGGRIDIGWDHGPVKILDIEPDRVLEYSWALPDHPDTVVRWELSGSEGRTHITVVHSGFVDEDLAEQYRHGWVGFLIQLKLLVEGAPPVETPWTLKAT